MNFLVKFTTETNELPIVKFTTEPNKQTFTASFEIYTW